MNSNGGINVGASTSNGISNSNNVVSNERNDDAPKTPFSIWKVPEAKAIKEAMKCKICSTLVVPPNFQCRNGHLICRNHFETIYDSRGNAKQQQLTICPVVNGKGEVCNGYVFEANLELYTKLYNGCVMNCPASYFGCEKKIKAAKLNDHLKKCIYNAVKECPNEYCGKRDVALPKLVDHLVGGDRVPVFIIEEGKPILIPISDEMQKHDIPLPASNCFHWIAAILQYNNLNAMVVVRQGTTDVKMWLHELYDWEPKDPTDENPVRRLSSILSCKLSMTKNGKGTSIFVRIASPKKSYNQVLENGIDVLSVPKSGLSKYLLKNTRFNMWQLEIEVEEDKAESIEDGSENN